MARTTVAHSEVLAAAGRVHWLVEATIAGRTYRVSDEERSVTDAAGRAWLYVAGLGDFTFKATANGDATAQIVLAPDVIGTSEGWPSVMAAPPHGSPVTIRRWCEGQLLEDARVVLDGEVFDAEYDDDDAPLSLSVRWLAQSPQAIPPAQAIIDTTTWPASGYSSYVPDEQVLGAVYPLVFGQPGYRTAVAWGGNNKVAYPTPGYLAQHSGGAAAYSGSRIVIGWVPDGTSYAASTVTLYRHHDDTTSSNGRGFAVQALTVSSGQDLLGRTVAYVTPGAYTGANTTIVFRPGSEYWIRWDSGGGVRDEARSGSMRKAGEVIAYLLRIGGIRVDAGRMAAARDRLDRYLLDFAITDTVDDPRAFVEQHIGRLIPLARKTSADGIWYEALNYTPSPQDAVMHLVVPTRSEIAAGYVEIDPTTAAPMVLVQRASTVAYTDDDVVNTLTVRYAPDRGTQPTLEVVVTGSYAPSSAKNEIGSVVASSSRARYGERTGEPLEARLVHDRATAEIVALEAAVRLGYPRRLVAFRGDVADLEVLEVGDVVRVTDQPRALDGHLAIVQEIEYSLTTLDVRLEVLDYLQQIAPVLPEEESYAAAFPGASVIIDAFSVTGSTISSLRDLSGNGYDLTSVTGSAPTFSPSYAYFGGRPAILCSGGSIATTQTFTAGDLTLVIAFRDDGTLTNEEAPAGLYYSDNAWIGRRTTTASTWSFGIIEPAAPYGQLITVADQAPHVVVLRRQGSTHTAWVDGVLAGTTTGSSSATSARSFKVGGGTGGGNFTGAVAFAGYWSRGLTDDEIRALSNRVWRGALGQQGRLV